MQLSFLQQPKSGDQDTWSMKNFLFFFYKKYEEFSFFYKYEEINHPKNGIKHTSRLSSMYARMIGRGFVSIGTIEIWPFIAAPQSLTSSCRTVFTIHKGLSSAPAGPNKIKHQKMKNKVILVKCGSK
jgi:hypothetical protein